MSFDKLLELLLREPLLLVILLGWIAGGIGKLAQAKKKRAASERRSAEATPTLPNAAGAQGSLPQAAERARRARTKEEVAAEMRRILGMEPTPLQKPTVKAKAPAPKPPPPPQRIPIGQPLSRPAPALGRQVEANEGDVGSHPMRPSQFARVGTHVDPHVGESMQARKSPRSGGVAAFELGTLGGRPAAVRFAGAARRGLVELGDLKRAIVLTEILGAPRALREWDR